MLRIRHRRAPHCHHLIPDVLVDDAALGGDCVRGELQPLVQHVDHLLRRVVLGHGREAAHVGKQRRHLAGLAAETEVALQERLGDIGRHDLVEHAAVALLQQQSAGHLIEPLGQGAELVVMRHVHREVVVAAPDAIGRAEENPDGRGELLRQHGAKQDGQQQGGDGGEQLDAPDAVEGREHVGEGHRDDRRDPVGRRQLRGGQRQASSVEREVGRRLAPCGGNHRPRERGTPRSGAGRQAARRREAHLGVDNRRQPRRHLVVHDETDGQAADRFVEQREWMRQHEEQPVVHEPIAARRAVLAASGRAGDLACGRVGQRLAIQQRQHCSPLRVVEADQTLTQFREVELVLDLCRELGAVAAIHHRIERGDDADRAAEAKDEALEFCSTEPFDFREGAACLLGPMLHDPGDLPLRLEADHEQPTEPEDADAADQRREQAHPEADVAQGPPQQRAESRAAGGRSAAHGERVTVAVPPSGTSTSACARRSNVSTTTRWRPAGTSSSWKRP